MVLQEWNAKKRKVLAEVKQLKVQIKDLKAKESREAERQHQDPSSGRGKGKG